MPAVAIVLISFAYLLGSVASAIVVSRVLGLPDPRSGGSGNPGATNVLRLGGKTAAAWTLIGDIGKGWLPVWLAQRAGMEPAVLAAVGAAAFLGHLFPVYFRFRGGKGVATFLGVTLGWSAPAGAAVMATWLLMAWISRISSLSALTAALLAPVFIAWATHVPLLAVTTAALTTLLYWRHRSNLRNLWRGTEDRIGGS